MKRTLSVILCIAFLSSFLIRSEAVYAASESAAPLPGNIIVTNNLNKADTVYVFDLNAGDLIKVYNSATGSAVLAYSVVPNKKSDVTISIDQLGSSAGSVYVSVVSKGKSESGRTKADYIGEPVSEAPSADNVTVTNNAGKADTIYISGLNARDVVKVYDAPVKGKLLATKTTASNASDLTISISQLGTAAGSIYVTNTSKNRLESARVRVDYSAETLSDAPSADNITVTNNVKGADTVYVGGLSGKDVVKVYNAETGGRLLGSKTVPASGFDATISVSQLGSASGYVYVSVTSTEKAESLRTRVGYEAEPGSDALPVDNIMVTNNAGKSDTVYVIGLTAGDVVKVYNAAVKGSLLGSATASASSSDATVTIAQLGTQAGSVYVTVTGSGKVESSRTEVTYPAEMKSSGLSENSITVTNNVGKPDTVYVKDLSGGDIVKVYNASSGGTLLGSKAVASSGTDATITIAQLGSGSGYVYVSVISSGKSESGRIQAYYDAEPVSDAVGDNNISVTNNAGAPDTVYVSGLASGDVVKVYNAERGGTLLGSATVPSSKTSATVSIAQLGTSSGKVYVAITKAGSQESARVAVTYSAEGVSDAPGINNIIVTNNVGKADTIYVNGLIGGDIVNVYNSDRQGALLGTATVSGSGTDATVTVPQLGTREGTIYVTVTSTGKMESGRVGVAYKGESASSGANSDNISVTNNAGIPDTVYISGLTAGDVVKVYDSALGGTLLGTATVGSTATDTTVTIPQLGTSAGSVYVTVTSSNKAESARIEAVYAAEAYSPAPLADNIAVTNNISGTPDTIYVSGLRAGDIVKAYSASAQGTLLGSATVSGTNTNATISIAQLGPDQGSVFITITSTGKLESSRTEAPYSAEGKSDAPSPGDITVTNNAGAPDTVYVSGLTANDVVRVYDAPKAGNLLGTATVSTFNSSVTISITQLGSTSGSVYVTVASANKAESGRVQADYTAEPLSSEPTGADITVINNAGAPDIIRMTGLTAGDVVRVYDKDKGGNQIGTATAAAGETSVSITIAQLGSAAGSVYVSVTGSNKLESGRVRADYPAEGVSAAPAPGDISINNNSGAPDTVKVSGLASADVVKVYDASRGGSLLGTATVSTFASDATVTITQLGTTAGKVYVTVTNPNKSESERTEADYDAEPSSPGTGPGNITVTNNAGMPDTVYVTGLTAGDVVKVYDAPAGGNLLGTATVPASATDVAVEINQLGSTAGLVYVSVTSTNKAESGRTGANYNAEAKTEAPAASNISVSNNAGVASSVEVSGLKDYDAVRIYDAAVGGTLLGSGTVEMYKTEVTISVSQLNSQGGRIYVTVTGRGKLESARTEVEYTAKTATRAPSAASSTIENNAGIPDTVTVTGLDQGTVLKVYDRPAGGTPIATATVPSGSMEATAIITQLGTEAGSVYISLTAPGKTESERVRIDYTSESESHAIAAGNVTVANNSGISDTITITGLSEGDVIKIYNSAEGGNRIATATVQPGAVSVVISYSQLGTGAGSIYVSVTCKGKTESSRTKVDYAAESIAPSASSIEIVNNAGIADTITVSGLAENDAVRVYDAPSSGNLLGTALVAPGNTKATISVPQLTQTAGSVYVTVTNFGKAESSRTKADYMAEQSATAPYLGNIYIVNNSGMDDTITVTGLVPGDVIKVYDLPTGGRLLGYASVAPNSTQAIVSVEQLGISAGSVYISLTTRGRAESGRTEASYVSESTSTTPYQGNIYIVNNVGIADTVLVTGLKPGGVVRVYDAAAGGSLLGYATAVSDSAQVNIPQLGVDAGSVYISVTEPGKMESARTRTDYVSEQTTNAPYEGNVKIVNNAGSPDAITVTGLSTGDLVKVYDASAGGNLLGNATAASGSVQATVTVTQLGTSSGSVYISVTSPGKTESARTKVDYIAEAN
jgi:hypothetical protein